MDDLTKLADVMRDRAAEVPHLQVMPRDLPGRARWRIVRNAAASLVAAGLVVAAALAGLAGLGAAPSEIPGASPAPAPSIGSCTVADLRATAVLGGAAGSVVGSIDLTNHGATTCTLEGRPVLTILSSQGHEVTVDITFGKPQWQVDGQSPPRGWPVVRLAPGSAAAIRVGWSNQCPHLTNPVVWSVELPGVGGSLVTAGDPTQPPACLGAAEPSTLEVGPFEPGGGG